VKIAVIALLALNVGSALFNAVAQTDESMRLAMVALNLGACIALAFSLGHNAGVNR
jgi:short-subunit dehydrogenase